jgi:hypothetical protein
MDPSFTTPLRGAQRGVHPAGRIRYVNWRFVTSNNVDASPPLAPTIETFSLSYRFQRVQ